MRHVSLATLLAVLCWCGCAVADEYKIQRGDVVEISVTGIPDLKRRSLVTLEGRFSFPLVGELEIVGHTASEIRQRLREILPAKLYQQRTADGRELVIAIPADSIVVEVVEYRPIYLTGDVANPGEKPFRPGISVRQAISLAGGYEMVRLRMNNPYLESADLRGEYDSLWVDYAREQARIRRLETELGLRREPHADASQNLTLPRQLLADIEAAEKRELELRQADLEKERAHLKSVARQTEEQVKILIDRQTKEDEGARSDLDDFERMRELFKKGAVPMSRLSETRRFHLLSSSQLLQTTVQIRQTDRELAELRRRLERIGDQRQIEAVRELQDARVKIASIQSRILAISEKLSYVGMIRSQLARGKGGQPVIAIFRSTNGPAIRIPANENTLLAPGDVIEVALRLEPEQGLPAQ